MHYTLHRIAEKVITFENGKLQHELYGRMTCVEEFFVESRVSNTSTGGVDWHRMATWGCVEDGRGTILLRTS